MGEVNLTKLRKIRDNYPETWEWMRHKASWEHMTLAAVLNSYEPFIDERMVNEDKKENR